MRCSNSSSNEGFHEIYIYIYRWCFVFMYHLWLLCTLTSLRMVTCLVTLIFIFRLFSLYWHILLTLKCSLWSSGGPGTYMHFDFVIIDAFISYLSDIFKDFDQLIMKEEFGQQYGEWIHNLEDEDSVELHKTILVYHVEVLVQQSCITKYVLCIEVFSIKLQTTRSKSCGIPEKLTKSSLQEWSTALGPEGWVQMICCVNCSSHF